MNPETMDRIACLMILDIMLEATPRYWEKRARDFDKVGTPDHDQIAQACRNKATFIREHGDPDTADLWPIVLSEVA